MCCRCSRETPDEMQRLRTPFPSRGRPRVDVVPTHRGCAWTRVWLYVTHASIKLKKAEVRPRVTRGRLGSEAGFWPRVSRPRQGSPEGAHQGPAPNDEVRLCAQPGYEGQPSAPGHGRTFTY